MRFSVPPPTNVYNLFGDRFNSFKKLPVNVNDTMRTPVFSGSIKSDTNLRYRYAVLLEHVAIDSAMALL